MIVVKNVNKKFHEDYNALLNVSFSTEERPLVIVGEDGAGKTTLLEILAGLDKNYCGEIYINGEERKLIKNENLPISYIATDPVLFKFKTVYKNLEYVFKIKNKKIIKNEIQLKLGQIAKDLNIIELLNKRVYKLRMFEKKMVCLARAAIKNSKIILIDEPFFKLNSFEISSLWQSILSVSSKLSSDLIVSEKGQNIGYFNDCEILKMDFGTIS